MARNKGCSKSYYPTRSEKYLYVLRKCERYHELAGFQGHILISHIYYLTNHRGFSKIPMGDAVASFASREDVLFSSGDSV